MTQEAVPTSADRKPCPMCGELIVASAVKCRYCGHYLDPKLKPRASQVDRLLLPVETPFSAIAAGYLGLFSILPLFGILAIIVSIVALRQLKKTPELAGRGRAWFGLIAGVVSTLAFASALVMVSR